MATSGTCGTNLTYEIVNNVLTISGAGTTIMDSPGWDKTFTSVVFDTPNLTSIGKSAFRGCTSLTSVTLPASLTTIKDYAFRECTNLSSISIPDSVTSIGMYVFQECTSLTSVTLPASLTTINKYMFYGCTNLSSIPIPDSVTLIDSNAFVGCISLTTISIPDGVTSIGALAFQNCTSLTSVTLPASVTSIGSNAFERTSLTTISIPDSVTSIGMYVFQGCTNLTSITIPDSVTSIGYGAFNGCTNLSSVTLPASVTTISGATFQYCTSLSSISIPDGVTLIDSNAFRGCTSLSSVTLPASLTTINDNAFYGCTSLTSVTLPASLTKIYNYAFQGCTNLATIYNLSDLNVVAGATTHGYVAYYATSISTTLPEEGPATSGDCGDALTWDIEEETLTITGDGTVMSNYSSQNPAPWNESAEAIETVEFETTSLTNIGNYAFAETNVSSVEIPETVTTIGANAFEGTKLTSVDIPDNVTAIGEQSFANIPTLKKVTLGSSVSNIGTNAFSLGTEVEEVTNNSTVLKLGEGVADGGLLMSATNVDNTQFPEETPGENEPEPVKPAGAYFDSTPRAKKSSLMKLIGDITKGKQAGYEIHKIPLPATGWTNGEYRVKMPVLTTKDVILMDASDIEGQLIINAFGITAEIGNVRIDGSGEIVFSRAVDSTEIIVGDGNLSWVGGPEVIIIRFPYYVQDFGTEAQMARTNVLIEKLNGEF